MPDPSFRNPRTGALSALAKYMRGQIDETEFRRQQRGEQFFPREGTHATRAWFNEFNQKKGDLGFHFGTEEQARQRMIHTRDSSNEHLPERYIDARLRANSPLYYPGDVGAWDLSQESARALLASRPYGASTREGFANIIGDKERDWLQKIRDRRILTDHQDALEEMRQMMEKQGFDSLIYRNTVENLHGATPGMSPRALEAYNRLQQQREAIDLKRADDYRKANPRSVDDMPPRDPQTQKLIPFSDRAKQRDYEKWEKGRRPWTEEERARDFALYNRMNKIEGIGQNDPNSIIVLRPNQIRSVNADFDPAKLSSGNLLAGTAAGAIGIGAATASEEEREPYADGGPANPRLGALSKLATRIANPIRAYHGTPHKFDKFDISKIGTGEGAQSYGYGLYFAENPAVANSYKRTFEEKAGPQFTPLVMNISPPSDATKRQVRFIENALKNYGGDVADSIRALDNGLYYSAPEMSKSWVRDIQYAIDALKNKRVGINWEGGDPIPSAYMYNVNLHSPKEKFITGDKWWTEQPPEARQVFDHYLKDAIWRDSSRLEMPVRALTGLDEYFELAKKLSDNPNSNWASKSGKINATNVLREAGVPGIRYLDEGSRAAGTGTHNIVMFDDAPIEIVERKAEGGMVDPDGINKEPMASGGALAMNEGGSVYERLAARVRAAFEEQEAPGFADGGDIDWNSYAQTYQQMLNPAMSGSTGLKYTEPVGAQQQPVDPIGSRLSSFTPGSAGVPGGSGQATVDTRSVSVPGMSAGRALGAMGTLGSAMTGFPGLGLAGAALGNALEAREYNAALDAARSANPQYSFPGLSFGQIASGIGNTVTGGLLGTSLNDSFVDNAIAGTSQSRGGASGPGTGDPEADAAAAAAAASSGLGNAAEAAVDSGQIS